MPAEAKVKVTGRKSCDLAIIGSGPAGIHAAVQAAKLNKKVVVIEKTPERIGGVWIHTGTLPSKTLREVAEAIHRIKFHVGNEWVDRLVNDISPATLFGRASHVCNQEESHVRRYLTKNNVEVVSGTGRLESEHSVRVIPANADPYVIDAQHILIGTGSRPRRPDDIPFDGWRIVDSDEILKLASLPRKLSIYGAGVIGCEYACIFQALGCQVTIFDARGVVMQNLDREITEELKKIMEAQGIRFCMNHTLDKVSGDGANALASFNDGNIVDKADVFFFAAGRVSNTENIGLERLGITCNDRGAIKVNSHFQTNIPSIYAAGDAIGFPALAATSAEQGRHAVCHAFGNVEKQFPSVFPIGVYTIPELSAIGKSEEELIADKVEFVVGRAKFTELARGYIRGDNNGLFKLLICKNTQKILGIHCVGADAANLIHIGLAVMMNDGFAQDFVDRIIFNYPTLAEAFRIAAFNGLNKIFKDGIIAPPNRHAELNIRKDRAA
jgi:NAD(P) transhydrogenase